MPDVPALPTLVPGSPTGDDPAWLDRLLAGDEATFTDLLRRYHGAMVRVALLYVGNPATAEEVAQESWLAVLRGLPQFERRAKFKTWLFRIVANRARTRAVRDQRYVPFATRLDEDGGESTVDPSRFDASGHWIASPIAWQDAEARLAERELVEVLMQGLATLPEVQRAVVTLRDVEGLDAEEVCQMLEITEGNQRVLLHRGRTKLRRILDAHLAHASTGDGPEGSHETR